MINHEDNNGADDRDEHAVEVEPGHAGVPDKFEQPAADQCADDPKNDVEKEALPLLIYNLAGGKTSDQAESGFRTAWADNLNVTPSSEQRG